MAGMISQQNATRAFKPGSMTSELLANVDVALLEAPSATVASKVYVKEATDNGTHKITLTAATSLAADYTLTLPSVTANVMSDEFCVTSGHIAVADGTRLVDVAVSGDVTLAANGAVTIANNAVTAVKINADAVTTAKILDANVTAAKLATSAVSPTATAGLADTAATLRVVTPVVYRLAVAAADFGANDDIIIAVPAGHNILITDVFFHLTTVEGGAMTGTLRTAANGGGTAISSALDLDATNGDILRTTTIGGQAVAAGANLYFHASGNPGTLAGWLYIVATHTT
jgi:hypothetical protein